MPPIAVQNSGTSYTLDLTKTATGKRTATNYGGSSGVASESESVSVFVGTGGPFWHDSMSNRVTKPTRGYVLTKTHCGGYCNQYCPSGKYHIEDHWVFLQQCLKSNYRVRLPGGKLKEVKGSYNKDLVARAVHLIRDPFDNIVSRYHDGLVKKNDTASLAMFPKSKEGVSVYCSMPLLLEIDLTAI